MAASVDYNNVNPTEGIYGVYNKFIARMTAPSKDAGDDKLKHSFRVRVTPLNDTSKQIIRDFKSVKDVGVAFPTLRANVNPVEPLRNTFFSFEYSGISEFTSSLAYSAVTIDIGEVYTTDPEIAPTFRGYDIVQEEGFFFYNGYERFDPIGLIGLNYREPKWYDETPHLLPKVKKTLYLLEGDEEFLSIPSYLNVYPEILGSDTNLKNLVTEIYNGDGTLDTTSTINLRLRPDLSGVGYWNISAGVNPFNLTDGQYAEVYAQWVTDGKEAGLLVDSERITVKRLKCKPKDDNFRLRWINRYGGLEYQNFQLKTDRSIQIKRGKKISSTGIDYDAATFADISNINNPNLKEFGTSYVTKFKLRSDFLTQEELNALQEAFVSSKVAIVDGLEEIPVIVEDSSYRILDVKQKLQKVEINVRLANFEPNQV